MSWHWLNVRESQLSLSLGPAPYLWPSWARALMVRGLPSVGICRLMSGSGQRLYERWRGASVAVERHRSSSRHLTATCNSLSNLSATARATQCYVLPPPLRHPRLSFRPKASRHGEETSPTFIRSRRGKGRRERREDEWEGKRLPYHYASA